MSKVIEVEATRLDLSSGSIVQLRCLNHPNPIVCECLRLIADRLNAAEYGLLRPLLERHGVDPAELEGAG